MKKSQKFQKIERQLQMTMIKKYLKKDIYLQKKDRKIAVAAGGGNNNIQVVFKNCSPFTNCISEINNTQINNAKDNDVVMPMYNLMKYSGKHQEAYGNTIEMNQL